MKSISWLILFAIFVPLVPTVLAQAPERFDVLITNARIVDGTGNPWFWGSVAIRDGKIAGVGRVNGTATQTIDAKGQIVAPGFIDVHGHTEDIFSNPTAENFVRMGVTSIITGNCGGSAEEIGQFLGQFGEKPLDVNLAGLSGRNTLPRGGGRSIPGKLGGRAGGYGTILREVWGEAIGGKSRWVDGP